MTADPGLGASDAEPDRPDGARDEAWQGVSRAVLERLVDRLPVPFAPRPLERRESDTAATARPASYVQKTAWERARGATGGHPHIIPRAYRLRGSLDCDALARSLNVLVRKHEALRTTFAEFDGSLAQVIAARGVSLFRRTDLANLPEEEREFAIRRLVRRELRRPFDLQRGPMMRALLIRVDDEDHVLLLTVHVLASDWWSIGLLWRELGAAYTADLGGTPWEDASEAGIGHRADEVVDPGSLHYWQGLAQNEDGILDLPRDRVGKSGSGAPLGRAEVTLDTGLFERMRAISVSERVSLYMVLLAGYAALLRRFTGQERLLIGSPVSHRVRPELENVVGLLASLGAVQIATDGAPSFRELIRRARAAALDAYVHQGQAALAPADSIPAYRAPRLDTALSLRGAPGDPPAMPGISAELLPLDDGAAIVELMVHFEPRGDSLVGVATYRADVFAPATINGMLDQFVRILQGGLADPDRPVGSLPLLSATERRRVLNLGRGPVVQLDPDATIWSLFEVQSARAPGARALNWNGEERTYCEVRTDARMIACALRDVGLGSGSRVGVVMEPSGQLVPTMLGVMAAGAAVVPLDPDTADARRRFIAADANLDLVLAVGAPGQADGATVPTLQVTQILDGPGPALGARPLDAPVQEEPAFVNYVGGDEAGVVVEHGSILNWIAGQQESLGSNAGAAVAHSFSELRESPWLPLLPLLSGGTSVLIHDGIDTPEIVSLLAGGAVSAARVDAPAMDRLLEAPDEGLATCAALRLVASDVRGLTPETIATFYRRTRGAGVDARLHGYFGCPETTGDGAAIAFPPVDTVATSTLAGRASANSRLYVVDERGALCPVGVPGTVWIGGPSVARGYLDRVDLTTDRFLPDPFARGGRVFRTSERARWRTDGGLERLGPLRL